MDRMKRRALLALIGTAATAGCSGASGLTGDDSEDMIAVSSEYNCIELQDPPCTASVTVDSLGNATQLVAEVTNASGPSEKHILSTEGAELEVDGLRREQNLKIYAETDDTRYLFTEVPTDEQRQRENTESTSSAES